jgi:formylglycine-generating enzyme required for sulfatase activity
VLTDNPRPIRTLRPNLPAHVERTLTAGLAKLAADRPPTARRFVDMLTRPTAERRWATRPRWQIAALAAVLLGGAAIALSLVRHHPPPAGAAPAGMVLVPSGAYRVSGTRPGATAVELDSFYIDSTEVTVGAYAPFLLATHAPAPWTQPPPATWPVTGVLWAEAQVFCRWRDPAARLPTEAEWEAAAGGLSGTTYPWGNDWEPRRANAAGATDTLKPVGSFPLGRSARGVVDLIGNAWEWVAAETLSSSGQRVHAIKGGAFDTPPRNAVISYRAWFPEDRQAVWKTGFRCAR